MTNVKIYQGDCLEILKSLPTGSVDVVVTDPPYGVGRDEGFEGFGGFGKPIARRQFDGGWDKERPGAEYFAEILRVGKTALIFGGNYFADLLPVGGHWIVWDKKQTMPTFGDCELVWTNVKRKSVKWIQREWNGLLGKEQRREHPTQKPLSIMNWLISNYTQPGATILDPFMGSGTTGVAAVKMGRNFIGIEIDEGYYKIAEKRIAEAQMQLPLLEGIA